MCSATSAHLEVGHEREERHDKDRDHDHQADGQVHGPVRVPHHVVARPVDRLVHVTPADYPGQEAGLPHEEVQEEPHGTWWIPRQKRIGESWRSVRYTRNINTHNQRVSLKPHLLVYSAPIRVLGSDCCAPLGIYTKLLIAVAPAKHRHNIFLTTAKRCIPL